ncbi:MAG TPA: biliverdin-producing heme oxygenase [Bryobacteraceae bacterium]|nr:biliverdin-producing heme oxygenase [Bryobacteraceae bacterium]
MSDILSALKSETAEWHARVEASLPVLSETFDRASYIRLLERFYGFYAPLEKEIARAAACLDTLLPDWQKRLRLPLLAADLCWFCRTPSDLEAIPVCSALPELKSAEQIFGSLYVTEGATLGGQIISRHLAKSLSVSPAAGAAFFSAHGYATGLMWRVFTTALRQVASTANQRQIIKSAEHTFEAFWLWLSKPSV